LPSDVVVAKGIQGGRPPTARFPAGDNWRRTKWRWMCRPRKHQGLCKKTGFLTTRTLVWKRPVRRLRDRIPFRPWNRWAAAQIVAAATRAGFVCCRLAGGGDTVAGPWPMPVWKRISLMSRPLRAGPFPGMAGKEKPCPVSRGPVFKIKNFLRSKIFPNGKDR